MNLKRKKKFSKKVPKCQHRDQKLEMLIQALSFLVYPDPSFTLYSNQVHKSPDRKYAKRFVFVMPQFDRIKSISFHSNFRFFLFFLFSFVTSEHPWKIYAPQQTNLNKIHTFKSTIRMKTVFQVMRGTATAKCMLSVCIRFRPESVVAA